MWKELSGMFYERGRGIKYRINGKIISKKLMKYEIFFNIYFFFSYFFKWRLLWLKVNKVSNVFEILDMLYFYVV